MIQDGTSIIHIAAPFQAITNENTAENERHGFPVSLHHIYPVLLPVSNGRMHDVNIILTDLLIGIDLPFPEHPYAGNRIDTGIQHQVDNFAVVDKAGLNDPV